MSFVFVRRTPAVVVRAATACALALLVPCPARAQSFESIGVRAQGMGGAFVAVADDATASWWNPAGLAGGAYFDALIEFDRARQPWFDRDESGAPVPAWRSSVRGVAIGFPALALSYYRLRISQLQPARTTGGAPAGRLGTGTGEVRLRSLVLRQFGATVGQSLGEHIVLASTLKLVRGGLAVSVRPAAEASLEAADELEDESQTHGDLDVGALALVGRLRLGLSLKNVTEPAFSNGMDDIDVPRQVRAGVAYGAGRQRPDDLTVAVDADLTTITTVTGEERHLAAGVEAWTPGRAVAVRGGLRINTVGQLRPTVSGGASLSVRRSTYLEGAIGRGSDAKNGSWSVGLRLTF